jgi:hypothetical protein
VLSSSGSRPESGVSQLALQKPGQIARSLRYLRVYARTLVCHLRTYRKAPFSKPVPVSRLALTVTASHPFTASASTGNNLLRLHS